jgi:hypothetical protein
MGLIATQLDFGSDLTTAMINSSRNIRNQLASGTAVVTEKVTAFPAGIILRVVSFNFLAVAPQ